MIPLACLHGIVTKLARSDLTPPQWNAPVIFGRVTARGLLHHKAGLLNRTGEFLPPTAYPLPAVVKPLVLDYETSLGNLLRCLPPIPTVFWFLTLDPASTTTTIEVRARGY
jgi:hypothetical protein